MFRKTFELAPIGIAMVDLNYQLMKANRAYCEILGYSEEELRKMKLPDFTHPDDIEKNMMLQASLAKGEIPYFEMEKRFIRKSGNIVYGILCATLIRDQQGKPLYFIGQVLDITDRKKAEESLRIAEREKAAILDSISEIVAYTDTDYRILWANRAASNFSGISYEQLTGRYCYEVWFGRNAPCRSCPVTKTIRTCRIHEGELVGPRGGLWSIRGYPVKDDDGNLIGIVEIVRDITEKRKMENELMKARKLESIGILAGGIAHDFNNVLSVILGNIEMASIRMQKEFAGAGFLKAAKKATLRAKELTHRLITFSKGGDPIRKTGDIGKLVKETATDILSDSGIRYEFLMPRMLPQVKFDADQMKHVITNLLVNAREAMPQGGTVRIRAEHMTADSEAIKQGIPLEEGGYVKISVRDQGIGIPKDLLPLIFDPYFSTKEMGAQKGIGMGLATSYSIVRKHGGHITAESQPGRGSTFYIYLPVNNKKNKLITFAKDTLERKTGDMKRDECKSKILVMDDEEMILDIANQMLAHLGYEIELARDGTEAVELYAKAMKSRQPFGAVILDLTVPKGMGGKEAVKKLLEIDPHVKAVVSSGYCEDPIMINCEAYGFADSVAKPYSIKSLKETLTKILIGPELRD